MNAETDAYSRTVKNFVSLNRIATLSTISHSFHGYPFGSIVPYDIDAQGRFIIFISDIAEHFRNIVNDPRASLFVADRFGVDDPQAHARAAFLGTFQEVPIDEREAVEQAYWKRFPTAVDRSIVHTFHFFRMTPERIRWIGDFGDIRWVDARNFATCPLDPISYSGYHAVIHMNQDHKDALRDLVCCHSTLLRPEEKDVKMTAISGTSFVITATLDGESRRIEIPFSRPLTQATDVRAALISLLKECRVRLD